MAKIGIIHNPNASRARKHPELIEEYYQIVKDCGDIFVTKSIDELPKVLSKINENGYNILGISGGDGTFQKTLTKYLSLHTSNGLPPILPIKCGTMNTVSRALGARMSNIKFLKTVIEKITRGEELITRPAKIMKINSNYGHLFGLGLAARFVAAFRSTATHPSDALWLTLKTIFSSMFQTQFTQEMFEPFQARITIDGKPLEMEEFRTIFCATVDSVGLGFRIPYRAFERDDCFHLLASSLPPSYSARFIFHLYFGWPVRNEMIIDRITPRMKIITTEPQLAVLNGEVWEMEETEINIEIGPPLTYILG